MPNSSSGYTKQVMLTHDDISTNKQKIKNDKISKRKQKKYGWPIQDS